jgi:hypothetical protein
MHKRDCIWILWDAIKYIENKSNQLISKRLIQFSIFCIKYTTGAKNENTYIFRDERAHRPNPTAELIQEHDKPTIKAL